MARDQPAKKKSVSFYAVTAMELINEREFQRVPGLRLENWTVEPAQG
ncbi:type II toxin-antitoxin system VapC family toxin [Bordetella genomosp. 10]|nr:type II toxin-antitoxin system VapC family toxin [Bordetella genomosp. 10]